jgi:hypothetical protein
MTFSYDTWRTTPPEDLRPVSRYMPETVTAPLDIETDDDFFGALGTYDAGTGVLVSVEIDDVDYDVDQIEMAMRIFRYNYPRWKQALDRQTLAEKVREAAQDDAEAHGDYLYEQRQDRD